MRFHASKGERKMKFIDREEIRIGKIDTSREAEFFKKFGLIKEPEQIEEQEQEAGKHTERVEDVNKC